MKGQRVGKSKLGGKYTVTGVAEIDEALKGLEPKIAKKVLRSAMRQGMAVVRKEVIENTPVGETGDLAAAVKVRAGKTRKGKFKLKVVLGDGGDFQGKTFYGGMVEYGTSRQPAQGFVRKSYDAKGEEAKAITMRAIADGANEQIKASSLRKP